MEDRGEGAREESSERLPPYYAHQFEALEQQVTTRRYAAVDGPLNGRLQACVPSGTLLVMVDPRPEDPDNLMMVVLPPSAEEQLARFYAQDSLSLRDGRSAITRPMRP